MGLSQSVGLHDAVVEAAERCLDAPQLTATERSNAVQMVAWAHFTLGQYERCIDFTDSALQRQRPDESLTTAGLMLLPVCFSAYYSGRWTELERFLRIVEDARTEFRDDPGLGLHTGTYIIAVQLALARDNRPAVDSAAATLARLAQDLGRPVHRMLTALLEDNPNKLLMDFARLPNYPHIFIGWLAIFVERDMAPPPSLLQRAIDCAESQKVDSLLRLINTSHALVHRDAEQLSNAIVDAEKHGLIPHAARMRTVLARMTGDPSPLEKARPVLERLEDRQFLRRLEDVAASLL